MLQQIQKGHLATSISLSSSSLSSSPRHVDISLFFIPVVVVVCCCCRHLVVVVISWSSLSLSQVIVVFVQCSVQSQSSSSSSMGNSPQRGPLSISTSGCPAPCCPGCWCAAPLQNKQLLALLGMKVVGGNLANQNDLQTLYQGVRSTNEGTLSITRLLNFGSPISQFQITPNNFHFFASRSFIFSNWSVDNCLSIKVAFVSILNLKEPNF